LIKIQPTIALIATISLLLKEIKLSIPNLLSVIWKQAFLWVLMVFWRKRSIKLWMLFVNTVLIQLPPSTFHWV